MPKNRKTIKTPKGVIKLNEARKLRIGTRSGGKSAHAMSSDALKAVLNNKDQGKYHNNAATVLKLRGIEIVWPGQLDKVSTVADLAADMGANSAG